MINFLQGILEHSDDILYGAGTEQYNKMVRDTEDRHRKFTMWGDETLNELNLRKKNLQEEEGNFERLMTLYKTKLPDDITLPDGVTIDEFLAPLSGQLGTGMFLGDEKLMAPRIKSFLEQTGGITKGDPYIPSVTYFEKNRAKLDSQMQNISGMGYSTWRALTKKGDLSMIEDVKPVDFSKPEYENAYSAAVADIGVTLENYNIWSEANSPLQKSMSQYGKYLLIKDQAIATTRNKDGSIDWSAALAKETELLQKHEIDFNKIQGFLGVDENTLRTLSTQGNVHLGVIADIASQLAALPPDSPRIAELRSRAANEMARAIDFQLNANKTYLEKVAKIGDTFPIPDQVIINKAKQILGNNFDSIVQQIGTAETDPNSSAINLPADMGGKNRVVYAYLKKPPGEGQGIWYVIDNFGVEIRTNLKQNEVFTANDGTTYNLNTDLRESESKAILYQAINSDIAKQVTTSGVVNYTDKDYAIQVARSLGYDFDEDGNINRINGLDAKPSDGHYNGFRHTAKTKIEEEISEPEFF